MYWARGSKKTRPRGAGGGKQDNWAREADWAMGSRRIGQGEQADWTRRRRNTGPGFTGGLG